MTNLTGLPIKLERTIDGPCAACGDDAVVIGSSDGLHSASLRCASCHRHRGWLPEVVADFLMDLMARFGRPTYPITVRNTGIGCEPGCARGGSVNSIHDMNRKQS
jgi:hypothetical protein